MPMGIAIFLGLIDHSWSLLISWHHSYVCSNFKRNFHWTQTCCLSPNILNSGHLSDIRYFKFIRYMIISFIRYMWFPVSTSKESPFSICLILRWTLGCQTLPDKESFLIWANYLGRIPTASWTLLHRPCMTWSWERTSCWVLCQVENVFHCPF